MASAYFPSALSSIVNHTHNLSTASAYFPGALSSIVARTSNISTASSFFPSQLSSIVSKTSNISTASSFFPSQLSSIVSKTSNLSTSSAFFPSILSTIQFGSNTPGHVVPPPTFDTLTTTSARFSWGSHPYAAHYQLRIKQPGGTVYQVKDNLYNCNVSLSTITFTSAVPYASGNWIPGVVGHNINGVGDVLWNSNNTQTMTSPFPGATITTGSGTNFIFRTGARDPDGFYYGHSVKLDSRNQTSGAGMLQTNYATIPASPQRFGSYISFTNSFSGNDLFSSGDTDSQGMPLYYTFMGSGGTQKAWFAPVYADGTGTSNWSNGSSTPYPSLDTQLTRYQTWRGTDSAFKEIRGL